MPRKQAKVVPVGDELQLDSYNPRLHTEDSSKFIQESLKEVGPFRSIAVDGDNVIRAGNDTYAQAKALGLKIQIVDADPDTLIAVRRKDLTGRRAVRAGLLDNRAPELSMWDVGKLSNFARNDADLIRGIFEQEAELSKAAGDTATNKTAVAGEKPEETLARLQAKWGVQLGDVWTIPSKATEGNHYLICGDCRDVDVVTIVGGRVQGVFTSPPYAEQRKTRYGGIPESEYVEWWNGVQKPVSEWLDDGASFFVNIKPHASGGQRSLYVMKLVIAMVEAYKWNYIEEYCWTHAKMPGKDKFRFRNGFEPVYQFCKSYAPNIYHDNVARFGDTQVFQDTLAAEKFDGSSIFDNKFDGIKGKILPGNVISAQGTDGIHPAAFPRGLAQFFIAAFSNIGERWVDPFVGGGTVVKTCEMNARLGVGIDQVPEYISLCLERMTELGLTPEKQ